MNNKNLSQQLCKICGIEPQIHFVDCGTPECMAEEYRQCFKCPEASPIEIYPDFEQPENFVKLEEIMLTVVKWVHEFDGGLMHEYILITKSGHKHEFKHKGQKFDNWFVERQDRTECLILFILCKVIPICGESIKQAIKVQEWMYG